MAVLSAVGGLLEGLSGAMKESNRLRLQLAIQKYERDRQEAEDKEAQRVRDAQLAQLLQQTSQSKTTFEQSQQDRELQRALASLGPFAPQQTQEQAAQFGVAELPPMGGDLLRLLTPEQQANPAIMQQVRTQAASIHGQRQALRVAGRAGATERAEERRQRGFTENLQTGVHVRAEEAVTREKAKAAADAATEQADRATRQKIVDTSRPVLLAKYGAISDEVRAFDASVPGYVSGATNSLTEPKRLDVVEEIKRQLLKEVDWNTPDGIRLAMNIAGVSPTERQQIEASLATWDELSSTFSPAEQARGRKAIAASLIPTGLQDYVLPEPKEDKLAAIQQYARFIEDPDIRDAVTQAAYSAASAGSDQPTSMLIEQFLLAAYTDKISRATDPAEIQALTVKIQQLVPSLQTSAFGGKEITANQRENVTRAWETFRAELGIGYAMAPTPEWKRTLQLDLDKDPKDAAKGTLRADFTDRAIDFTRRYFGESPGGRAFLNEVWPYTGIREEAFEQKIREKGYVPADDVPAWASPAAKASALSPTSLSSPVVPGAPTAADINFAIDNIERATTPEQLRYLLKKFPDSASPADQQRANDAADATAKRLGISQAPMPSGVNDWITQANPATQTTMAPGQSFERTPGASPGIPMSQPRATVPAPGPGMQQPRMGQAPPPVGPQVANAPTLTPDQITAMSRKGISPVVRRQVLRRMQLSEREINRLMQQYQWDRVT